MGTWTKELEDMYDRAINVVLGTGRNDGNEFMAAIDRGYQLHESGVKCPRECPSTETAETWRFFQFGWSYGFYSTRMKEADQRNRELKKAIPDFLARLESESKHDEVAELRQQLCKAKEAAVACQDFELAATLRDFADKFKPTQPKAEPQSVVIECEASTVQQAKKPVRKKK